MKHLRSLLAIAVAACAARGQPIISNLSASSSTGTAFGSGSSTNFKAGGFEIVASTRYRLNSVTLDISSSDPNARNDVQIWRGTSSPTTLIASLDGPNFNGPGEYTFETDDAVTLEAGQTYWVYVANTFPDAFTWEGRTTGPSGVGATDAGYVFNGSSSSFLNAYEVDASPIVGSAIISNLFAAETTGTAFGPAPITTNFKAAGFRMGAESFRLNGVTLAVNSSDPAAQADVQLWVGNSSGPIGQIATLSGPDFDGPGDYIFAPDTSVTLVAGRVYWLYVNNSLSTNWTWEARTTAPVGLGAVSVGYIFNGSPSSFENAYELNGTIIRGENIISNLREGPGGGTAFGSAATTTEKAGGFRMGSRDFELDEVAIAVASSAANARSRLQIWRGTSAPSVLVATLSGPVFNGENDYTFRPRVRTLLRGGETYWVYLDNAFPESFLWEGRNAPPSGPAAVNAGYLFNGSASSVLNGYEVRGTVQACSIIDISGPAQPGVPDGLLSGADFFEFLTRFENGDLSVDFSSAANPGVPDGLLSGADFLFFLDLFQQGC